MDKLIKLKKFNGISPLNYYDEYIFRQAQAQYLPDDNFCFEDGWVYTLQACRKLPLKLQLPIKDNNKLVFLTVKPDQSAIVIVNSIGWQSNDLIMLAATLKHIIKLSVIIKNVTKTDAPAFLAGYFRHYNDQEFWSEDCKYDDQTYPQRIIRIKDLLQLKGKNYYLLRRELNKNLPLKVQKYDPAYHSAAVKQLIRSQDHRFDFNLYDSHQVFLDLPESKFITALLFWLNNELAGYTLVDQISAQCAAYNVCVYNADIPYLSSAITFRTIQYLAEHKDYQFINFQGSEKRDLDRWKRKFNPEKSIDKVHLIYGEKEEGK